MEESEQLDGGFPVVVELAEKPLGLKPFPDWEETDIRRVARPGVIFQPFYDSGLKGIAVDVAGHSECIAVVVHQRTLVTVLEKVTDPVVPMVDVRGVFALQGPHGLT